MIVTTGVGLKVLSIADRGNLAQERVHLQVMRDCGGSFYLLLATVETPTGAIYAGNRPAYWFGPEAFKTGDNIIVYTKSGQDTKSVRPDGHMNHFFFWGMNVAMFEHVTARVVVAELNTWETGR
jgi:hypothetical protein